MKAFLIDDEIKAIDALKSMLTLFASQIEVVGSAQTVQSAVEQLRTMAVDVIFLDVSMGELGGFDLLLALEGQRDFEVIFVTAHKSFSIDAMRKGAFDYLLKPINPDELVAAVKRLEEKLQKGQGKTVVPPAEKKPQPSLGLPGIKETLFLESGLVEMVEANGNYSVFHQVNGEKAMVSRTLKEIEEKLSSHDFLRIHKSYLVNTRFITGISKQDGGAIVMKSGAQLPISRSRRNGILEEIESKRILL